MYKVWHSHNETIKLSACLHYTCTFPINLNKYMQHLEEVHVHVNFDRGRVLSCLDSSTFLTVNSSLVSVCFFLPKKTSM